MGRRRRVLALALGLVGLAGLAGLPLARTGLAAPPASKVETFALDNGLRVVLRRTPGAADGAVVVVYGIGGDHDPAGRSGLAHVIEQLYLLAGTEMMPARDRGDVRMRGPARGAWHGLGFDHVATEDHTMFGRILPSKEIESEVEDAADRMTSLRVTQPELAAAVGHVRDEIGRAQGAGPALAALEGARAVILEPRLRGRRLGRAEEVAAITLAEVKERLARLYRPKNAVLAVSGDVDLGLLRAQVKKRFGPIPAGEAVEAPADRPEIPLPPELAAAGAGPVTLTRPLRDAARGGSAALAVSAPRLEASKEYAAFLVLAARLYDGQFTTAKGAPVADPATFAFDPWRDPVGFTLSRPVPPGTTPDEAAMRLTAVLEAAGAAPVGGPDLVRARTRMNVWFGVPPIEGSFADQPLIVAYGDARREALNVDGDAVMKKVAGVKTDDVRAAAERPHRVVVVVPK